MSARMMMSHIGPSETQLAQADSFKNLELRIDALTELRRKGSVLPDELALAMDATLADLLFATALLELPSHWGDRHNLKSASRLDKLEELAKNLEHSDAGSDPFVQSIRQAVTETRRLSPSLKLILANLES
jgi:hypothetical protein